MTNASKTHQSGYDVEVYGLENDTFYGIHIPAIICICTSFVCAVVAVLLSFRQNSWRSFFSKWSKSERFIIYLAACDGLFNLAHFTDHMHVAIVQDHVYPPALCEFYGFMLMEFITAQNLMVNVVAVNAFMLMYFDRNINFGQRDWRLLTWTFGLPLVVGVVALACGMMGPNGVFCYFDAIKGKMLNIFLTTVPLLLVLLMNSVLYTLTWIKLHQQSKAFQETFHQMSAHMRASHRAARAMSLFVLAFFVQWWAMAIYGIIQMVTDDIPQVMFHLVTTFSNLGGVLNLSVYLIIRRRQLSKGEHVSETSKTTKRGRHVNDSTDNNVVTTTELDLSTNVGSKF